MNYDPFGEVQNGEDTFEEVAGKLSVGESVLLGWTDTAGTHFDILLCLGARPFGTNIQGGIRPRGDLFVSIMRHGAFAFEADHKDTHEGYYEEKLGKMGSPTATAFAELINGIKAYL